MRKTLKELLENTKKLEDMLNELDNGKNPILCSFNNDNFYINTETKGCLCIIDFKKDFIIDMLNLGNGLNALAEFVHVYINYINEIDLSLEGFLQDFIIEHIHEDKPIDWERLDSMCKNFTKNKNVYLSINCVTSNCLYRIKESRGPIYAPKKF